MVVKFYDETNNRFDAKADNDWVKLPGISQQVRRCC